MSPLSRPDNDRDTFAIRFQYSSTSRLHYVGRGIIDIGHNEDDPFAVKGIGRSDVEIVLFAIYCRHGEMHRLFSHPRRKSRANAVNRSASETRTAHPVFSSFILFRGGDYSVTFHVKYPSLATGVDDENTPPPSLPRNIMMLRVLRFPSRLKYDRCLIFVEMMIPNGPSEIPRVPRVFAEASEVNPSVSYAKRCF